MDASALPLQGLKVILYFGCAALGFNYAYTAFFSCFVLATALLIRFRSHGADKNFKMAAVGLGLIAGASVLALSPMGFAWKGDPVAQENMNQKSPAMADVHGMKLRQLITPIPEHPIGIFRAFAAKVGSAGFPLEYENSTERLGFLGSVGFLILLAVSLGLADGIAFQSNEAASLNLAVFLLATIGGLGSIFNLLISPEIRCYNRAGVFLSFFALVPVAAILARLEKHLVRRGRGAKTFQGVLGLVVLACVYDQISFDWIRSVHASSIARYQVAEDFVARIETGVPRGTAVFQMPAVQYPHTPPINAMLPHEHALGYVFSHALKWSWPALSGQAIMLNRELMGLAPGALVPRLKSLGFGGIWIDRNAYDDRGEHLVADLLKLAPGTILESSDKRYAFIRLL